jgi:dUTP pyrophosphatase
MSVGIIVGGMWITGHYLYFGDNREDLRILRGDGMAVGSEDTVRIKVMKLDAAAQLPRYAHTGPFGDLAADLYAITGAVLAPGATLAVATGVAMEFPSTHGALVEDRSGLAMRGVTTLAGVIDPGYRGEIRVVMTNLSGALVEIKAGDRIAQLRVVRRIEAEFDEVSALVEASRGAKGFGSTGR